MRKLLPIISVFILSGLLAEICQMKPVEPYEERGIILSEEPIPRWFVPGGYQTFCYLTIKKHQERARLQISYIRGACLMKDSVTELVLTDILPKREQCTGTDWDSEKRLSRQKMLLDKVFHRIKRRCYIRSLSQILLRLEDLRDVHLSYYSSRIESERMIRKSKLFRHIEGLLSDNGLEIADISYDNWFKAGDGTGDIFLDVSEKNGNQ